MKIICLEGCSGAGKTTQYKQLQKRLENKDSLFVVEKDYEPFKTIVQWWHSEKGPTSQLSREDIKLFAKARAETFQKNFSGKNLDFLVMDRYYYTSAVYQCSEKISPEQIIQINREYGSPTPNITLLFECDPEIAFERSEKRNEFTGGKHLFSTNSDKIKIIQERYRDLQNICPELHIINTEKSIDKITEEILSKLEYSRLTLSQQLAVSFLQLF
jgi:dTMP kinase